MQIDQTRFRLKPDQYFPAEQKKDLIVLHFTAGTTASGAHATWVTPVNGRQQRVATAYVVDLDGSVYEFFPPEAWAYHLGMKTGNPGWIQDKRSIGIEIVNPGPLKAVGDALNWYPKNFGVEWCKKTEASKYVAAKYRGFDYYAAFPEVQQEAVRELVAGLAERFSIPKVLPPEKKRTEFDPGYFQQFQGIASHQNVRADKFDIGPAWDWAALEARLERA
jgi:N-acetyl-anhydromuramyl-L-alanine amidase AmpD